MPRVPWRPSVVLVNHHALVKIPAHPESMYLWPFAFMLTGAFVLWIIGTDANRVARFFYLPFAMGTFLFMLGLWWMLVVRPPGKVRWKKVGGKNPVVLRPPHPRIVRAWPFIFVLVGAVHVLGLSRIAPASLYIGGFMFGAAIVWHVAVLRPRWRYRR